MNLHFLSLQMGLRLLLDLGSSVLMPLGIELSVSKLSFSDRLHLIVLEPDLPFALVLGPSDVVALLSKLAIDSVLPSLGLSNQLVSLRVAGADLRFVSGDFLLVMCMLLGHCRLPLGLQTFAFLFSSL